MNGRVAGGLFVLFVWSLSGCVFGIDVEPQFDENAPPAQVFWTAQMPKEVYFLQTPEEIDLRFEFECGAGACVTQCAVDGRWWDCESGERVPIDEEGSFVLAVRSVGVGVPGQMIEHEVEVRQGLALRLQGFPEQGETPFAYLQGLRADCHNLDCAIECEARFFPEGCTEQSCSSEPSLSCDGEFSLIVPGRGAVEFFVSGCVESEEQAEALCDSREVSWEVIAAEWSAVSIAGQTACGVLRGGALVCWGANATGQLGLGDRNERSRPTRVRGFFEALSVGPEATCAVDLDEKLWCWGRGIVPQAREEEVTRPARVGAVSFERVAVGEGYGCGLSTLGELYCWDREHLPQMLEGEEMNWTDVAVVGQEGCGVRDGELWCWAGFGDLEVVDFPSPVDRVTMNELGLCVISGGSLFCRGSALPSFSETSGLALAFDGAVDISLGTQHVCALTDGGEAFCWGENSAGELGVGDRQSREGPTTIESQHFSQVRVGDFFSCGVSDGRELFCWGDNSVGQLGIPGVSDEGVEPLRVPWSY